MSWLVCIGFVAIFFSVTFGLCKLDELARHTREFPKWSEQIARMFLSGGSVRKWR